MNCNEFLTTLHHRFDLPAVHREGFEDHAGACAACADLLEEAVALDRVLSLWSAPEPPPSLSAAVMEAVQNAMGNATCEDTQNCIHELVAGDLDPDATRRITLHLRHCAACEELEQEARRLRVAFKSWKVPGVSSDMTERLQEALKVQVHGTASGNAPRRRTGLRRVLLGDLRIPRFAAALLMIAAALSVANLWKALNDRNSSEVQVSLPEHKPVEIPQATVGAPPTLLTVSLYRAEPGVFDLSDSFSADYAPMRGSLLRSAGRR